MALDMAGDLAWKLQFVLQKLNSLESMVEGVLQRFNSLESSVSGIKRAVATVNVKTDDFEKAVETMDSSLTFLNRGIGQLKSRVSENEAEIKSLNNRILYQDVYSRRENLRFFNIPESTDTTEENAKELIYGFIKGELEVDRTRDIEFQRVHPIGAKKPDSPRPIISRFLCFPDREKVFRQTGELKDEIDVKLYADYPSEIQERRRKLWPRLKRSTEVSKRAFSTKKNLTSLSLIDMQLLKTYSLIVHVLTLFYYFPLVFPNIIIMTDYAW